MNIAATDLRMSWASSASFSSVSPSEEGGPQAGDLLEKKVWDLRDLSWSDLTGAPGCRIAWGLVARLGRWQALEAWTRWKSWELLSWGAGLRSLPLPASASSFTAKAQVDRERPAGRPTWLYPGAEGGHPGFLSLQDHTQRGNQCRLGNPEQTTVSQGCICRNKLCQVWPAGVTSSSGAGLASFWQSQNLQGQKFSTRGIFAPRGYLAMSGETIGCHNG